MTTDAHAQVQQDRLLKLCAAMLKCGQAIIKCDHPSSLCEEICRHVVELGGMKAV